MQEEGGKGLNMNVRPCPIVQGRENGRGEKKLEVSGTAEVELIGLTID